MIKKIFFTGIFILLFLSGYSQQDTAALVKDFSKVMSFSSQPYLHYNTVTTMSAVPVIQKEDTMMLTGVFYRYNNSLYYDNGVEEMFLQDSLIIQINKTRKSIWIGKVDKSTRESMNGLPVSISQLQDLFRKKYVISKSKVNSHSRLTFQSKQNASAFTAINTTIALEYSEKNYLPQVIEIDTYIQEPVSEELLEALKKEEIDVDKLMKTIDGEQYFVRNQKVSMAIAGIDNTKEKAMQIPSWMSRVEYMQGSQEFKGKGMYSEYEVTKMF